MAKNNFKTIDKFIEDPRRVIALVVVIVLVAVLLAVFWSKIKQLINGLSGKVQANAELNQYQAESGESLSLTNAEYTRLADKLYKAVKGVGTDETAIYAVFNALGNKADLLKLIAVFGTKDDMNLAQWIYDDLNSSEIRKVNTILANKGIDYAF